MKKMKAEELKQLYADGRQDFRGADLEGADLAGINLQRIYLQGANLRGADLRGADLRLAKLQGANLQGATLRGADLRGANLRGTNLFFTNLMSANLVCIDLPSPTMVMMAVWGIVSDGLCADLMRYDAWFSDIPDLFKRWAGGGECPYLQAKFQRACNFKEERSLYKSGPPRKGFNLMVRLIKEKCANSDWH